MSRYGSAIRLIIRHMGRDKRISLGSFLVLAIILLLIDFFWVATVNVDYQYSRLLQTVRMELFLSDGLSQSEIDHIDQALRDIDIVDSVIYYSKDDAARQFELDIGPGLLNGLEENPLPRSFLISFKGAHDLKTLDGLNQRLRKLTGVQDIEYGRDWIEKVERAGRTMRYIGYFLGALILFVVLLTMANTNRLTARSKAREFYQLTLLGAGPTYLVIPYLAEGFISGFIAAILGWTAILYSAEKISFTQFELLLPPVPEILIYSLLAGLTGMLGSYLGIRRYLL